MGIAQAQLAALVAVCTTPGVVRAGEPTRVDWGRGLVLADGLGIADRHAPSPAVALGTSRRAAEDAARARLRDLVGKLPLASGGTVAARAKDVGVRARLSRAVDDAFVTEAEPETDGSWRVTLAVPVEAVRQAIAGTRDLSAAGDDSPVVVVVDGAAAKPAVGYRVGGVAAATVFVSELPEWARTAPHAHATRVQSGTIELEHPVGGPATLFVIASQK
jgi:hypothetical protein